MGKQNQQRRAAKKRRRGRPPPPPLDEVIWAAAWSWNGDPATHEAWLDVLGGHGPAATEAVDRHLREAVGGLWQRGWTPTDVAHITGRHQSATHAAAVARTVLDDGRRRLRAGQDLHPRWVEQLTILDDGRLPVGADDLAVAVAVLGLLAGLPALPPTLPAPGEAASNGPLDRARGLDERMLTRVRALLAKAESTEYDEEAEALTAKAQELIARHAIDEALLHAGDAVGEPSVRRILIDDPYADAKSGLLAEVARANRCRVVYSPDFGWVTAFGYDGDLDAVELLAASLLAQATGALARHGSRRDTAGRSRTRSFRRAFLYGFAHRIGQRLADATDGEVAGTADKDRLLPVLAARDDRLRAAQDTAFPQTVKQATKVSNAGGWVAGQAAADLATLDATAGILPDA